MTAPPPDSEEFNRALMDALGKVSDAIRPIFDAEEGTGFPQFKGSAFVFEQGEGRLIVTAEHVLSDTPGPRYLAVRNGVFMPWPRTYSEIVAIDPSAKRPDVALVFAETSASGNAIPWNQIAPFQPFEAGAAFVASGFPASRAKLRANGFRAGLMFAVSGRAPDAVYADMKIDPQSFLVTTYDQHALVNEMGQARVGAVPEGLSGGALWVVAAEPRGNSYAIVPRVVGVITEYHPERKVFVAARIDCVVEAAGRRDPSRFDIKPAALR